MRTATHHLLLTIVLTIAIASCDKTASESQKVNQLYVTDKGDSLETGFWVFERGSNGVSKKGNFKDGFREGVWIYKTPTDSSSITWTVFSNDSLRLNLPDHAKFTNQELPVIFFGTIRENTEHCYYTLLQYNLKEINASVYDYIFQYIQSLENSAAEKLNKREVKKFNFKTTEVFRVTVDLEGERKYQAISYIFVFNGILYDLTYRDEMDKVEDIELEVFNDILYSFQKNDFDPFGFNNKSYTKEENVDVRTPIQN
jgi:hypothetical protein